LPTEQASNFLPLCAMPLLSLSLSLSSPHTAAWFSVHSSGRRAHGAAVEHGGSTHDAPSFLAGSSFPNGARAPDSTFFNPVVVAPGWRVGVVRVVCPCRARTGVDRWGGVTRLQLATTVAWDGEVNDSRWCRDSGWSWLDLPSPSWISAPPLLPPLPASPVSPAAMHLARKTSLCARDLGEGAGMQDLACCRLVKTTSTTRRHAFAPPRATGQLRRLARRHRGRQ
jgi:hypothetical protein